MKFIVKKCHLALDTDEKQLLDVLVAQARRLETLSASERMRGMVWAAVESCVREIAERVGHDGFLALEYHPETNELMGVVVFTELKGAF